MAMEDANIESKEDRSAVQVTCFNNIFFAVKKKQVMKFSLDILQMYLFRYEICLQKLRE